jgi:hypothetical protein
MRLIVGAFNAGIIGSFSHHIVLYCHLFLKPLDSEINVYSKYKQRGQLKLLEKKPTVLPQWVSITT